MKECVGSVSAISALWCNQQWIRLVDILLHMSTFFFPTDPNTACRGDENSVHDMLDDQLQHESVMITRA